jgi:hypothetical protein
MFKIKLLFYAETFELAVELWIRTNGCAACLDPQPPLATKPPIIIKLKGVSRSQSVEIWRLY